MRGFYGYQIDQIELLPVHVSELICLFSTRRANISGRPVASLLPSKHAFWDTSSSPSHARFASYFPFKCISGVEVGSSLQSQAISCYSLAEAIFSNRWVLLWCGCAWCQQFSQQVHQPSLQKSITFVLESLLADKPGGWKLLYLAEPDVAKGGWDWKV